MKQLRRVHRQSVLFLLVGLGLLLPTVDAFAQRRVKRKKLRAKKVYVLRSSVSAKRLRASQKMIRVGTVRLGARGARSVYCAGKGSRLACGMFTAAGKRVAGAKLVRTRSAGIVFDAGDGVSLVACVLDNGSGMIKRPTRRGVVSRKATVALDYDEELLKKQNIRSFQGFGAVTRVPARSVRTARDAVMFKPSFIGVRAPGKKLAPDSMTTPKRGATRR